MSFAEISEKLDSLRYCSEFDVLNDMVCRAEADEKNSAARAAEVKRRFCACFGRISEWSFGRLIKWCQANMYFHLCHCIRSRRIGGREFIEIVTDSVKCRLFSNLSNQSRNQLIKLIKNFDA